MLCDFLLIQGSDTYTATAIVVSPESGEKIAKMPYFGAFGVLH